MKSVRRSFLLTVIVFVTSTAVIAQSLVSIDPDNAQSGENLPVYITGLDTYFSQASVMSVWFAQGSSTIINAYGYAPFNDTYMAVWFDIPTDGTTGLHDLYVDNNIDGTLTLPNSFTIDPGSISVSPNTAQQGQKLAVAITGQDTNFSQASPATFLIFSQGSPTSQGTQTTTTWITDTLLLAEIEIDPCSTPGQYDIGIENDIDGTLTLYNGFTVTPYEPKITSITPHGAYQGQSLSVTITGQSTNFIQGTPTIGFGQGSTTKTVVWFSQGSSTIFSKDIYEHEISNRLLTVTFDIPEDADTGYWDVNVPNLEPEDRSILTLTDGFVITRPGDMTCDGMVNLDDFGVLAGNWLEGIEP